jgi:hypothetical protein
MIPRSAWGAGAQRRSGADDPGDRAAVSIRGARAIAVAWLLTIACARTPPADPVIRLVEQGTNGSASYVEVIGIGRGIHDAARRFEPAADDWQPLFSVHVVGPDGRGRPTAVAGRYIVADDALRFTPLFPFERGRQYEARYNAAALTPGAPAADRRQIVSLGAAAPSSPTSVTEVFPSGDSTPANQLRMYIHFSAPMGRRGGQSHVRLIDEHGREVIDPFLPLEAELWNADRTRYTLLFDPGRQKHGILPNREMGPSLIAGRRYTLIVDRGWTDGQGQPLGQAFTRTFRVGPPTVRPLDPSAWRVTPPAPGARDPLSIAFPAPLDHALLLSAIGVRHDGQPVAGEVRVDDHERRWTLTPAEAWRPGRYELVALPILEDVAGNRIGRAFEVDPRASTSTDGEGVTTVIPFTVSASSVAPRPARGTR